MPRRPWILTAMLGGSVGPPRLGFDDNRSFSDRVDPRSLRYHRVYADWSIPDLALK